MCKAQPKLVGTRLSLSRIQSHLLAFGQNRAVVGGATPLILDRLWGNAASVALLHIRDRGSGVAAAVVRQAEGNGLWYKRGEPVVLHRFREGSNCEGSMSWGIRPRAAQVVDSVCFAAGGRSCRSCTCRVCVALVECFSRSPSFANIALLTSRACLPALAGHECRCCPQAVAARVGPPGSASSAESVLCDQHAIHRNCGSVMRPSDRGPRW